jgi:hypothetical protein
LNGGIEKALYARLTRNSCESSKVKLSSWILATIIVIRRAFKAQRMIHKLAIENIGTGCRLKTKKGAGRANALRPS